MNRINFGNIEYMKSLNQFIWVVILSGCAVNLRNSDKKEAFYWSNNEEINSIIDSAQHHKTSVIEVLSQYSIKEAIEGFIIQDSIDNLNKQYGYSISLIQDDFYYKPWIPFEVCIINRDSMYINGMLGDTTTLKRELVMLGNGNLNLKPFVIGMRYNHDNMNRLNSILDFCKNHIEVSRNNQAQILYGAKFKELEFVEQIAVIKRVPFNVSILPNMIFCSTALTPNDLLKEDESAGD